MPEDNGWPNPVRTDNNGVENRQKDPRKNALAKMHTPIAIFMHLFILSLSTANTSY